MGYCFKDIEFSFWILTYSYSHTEYNQKRNNWCFIEQQKRVFENHVRIEDTHLDEAKAWEKKVERNRMKAARKWRAKMHCMQTIAEGRMADIERRKYDRKKNAAARQAAKVTLLKLDFAD